MAEFICPSCGNNQLCDRNGNPLSSIKAMDVNGSYVCSKCGAELTKEQKGQLLVAAVQEVTFSNNLYIQARNAKKSGDYTSAFNYYQQILAMDPNNWEAAFYCVFCNCHEATGAIENACDAVKMSLEGVFEKIDLLSGIEKQNAVKLMVSDSCLLALHMFDSAVRQHAALTDATAMSRHNGALKNQLISALNITITCADLIMKRYGDDDQLACLVEIPANCALKMQSRQRYVTLVLEPNTSRTLLEWIGRFNPAYVEEYKKKQNRSMATGTIFLMILGAIFLALGLTMEGMFASWFCMPMAIFCFVYGVFRIIIQLANKKLNG